MSSRLILQSMIATAYLLVCVNWGISQTTQFPGTEAINHADNPVEIGAVHWSRDLDVALATSKQNGKPVFLLFQEVPGCQGCQDFGKTVLSHPLLVEAIEEEFLPVVVFNNRAEGPDRVLLERFREPAWNYQVVRYLDHEGNDIIPRKDGVWSIAGVAARMISVLEKAQRTVPNYLRTIGPVADSEPMEQVALAMHCFWVGENQLGGLDGVVGTEAGWIEGREVTLVTFDPQRLQLENLIGQAANLECADKIYTRTKTLASRLDVGTLDNTYRRAKETDQKRHLMQWPEIRKIPEINSMQLTKLNALLNSNEQAALSWLSPRQKAALTELRGK